MTSSRRTQQQQIAAWFDRTYRARGGRYLRPLNAYYIFPELLEARPGQRLLDVACGLGRLLEAAAEYGCRLHGIDISRVAATDAARRLPGASIQVGNAEQLPFTDASFDLLTCLGSLERMLDRKKVLYEMYRVGTDVAKYCFLVRNADTLIWKYLRKGLKLRQSAAHQDALSLAEWRQLFESSGYVIRQVLPDQYPLHRRKKWSRIIPRDVNYRQPLTSTRPLHRANEFVFLLEKRR